MCSTSNELQAEIAILKGKNQKLSLYREIMDMLLHSEGYLPLVEAAISLFCRNFLAQGGVLLLSDAQVVKNHLVYKEYGAYGKAWDSLSQEARIHLFRASLNSNTPIVSDKPSALFIQTGITTSVQLENLISVPFQYDEITRGAFILFNLHDVTKLSDSATLLQELLQPVVSAFACKLLEERYARDSKILTSLLGNNTLVIACLDRDYKYTHVSSTYESIIGRSSQELLGNNILDILPKENVKQYLERVRDTKEPIVLREYPFQMHNQPCYKTTYWDGFFSPILNENDTVESFLLIFENVTERVLASKKAASARQAQERETHLLSTILNNAQPHMAYLDPDLRFIRANASYAEMAGFTPHELIGLHHLDVWQSPEGTADLERVRDTGEPVFRREHVHFHPQRGKTYWDWLAAALTDENGNFAGILISAVDVTEQVLSREKIAAAERRRAREARLLESLVEGIDYPLAYFDSNLTFLQINSAYCDSAGLPREQLLGRTFREVFPTASIAPILESVVETGERFVSRETPRRIKHSFERGISYWDTIVIPVKDQDGRVDGLVVSSMDVTEHVRTRERMLSAERDRTRLAETLTAEVNHRMKNNLSMVAGLLQMQIGGEDREIPGVESVHDAITRIRTFAAVHEQLYDRQAHSIVLLDAIRRIVENAGEALTHGNVETSIEGDSVSFPPKTALALCVIANELITNSIKHGRNAADGKLKIKVSVIIEGDFLRLSVWNSGNPIAADFNISKQRNMGLRLIQEMAVGQYKGTFNMVPKDEGTFAEVKIDENTLRREGHKDKFIDT